MKYYGNQECEVLATFDDRAVIRMTLGEVGIVTDSDIFVQSYDPPIIVDAAYVSAAPIAVNAAIEEAVGIIKVAKAEAGAYKAAARREIFLEKSTLERDLKELRKRASKVSVVGQLLDVIEGSAKYAVFACDEWSGRAGIIPIEELVDKDSRGALVAISIRDRQRAGRVGYDGALYAEQYSDGSGSTRARFAPCKDLESAKAQFLGNVNAESAKLCASVIDECRKWGIKSAKVDEHERVLAESKASNDKKEAALLRAKLAKLEGGI